MPFVKIKLSRMFKTSRRRRREDRRKKIGLSSRVKLDESREDGPKSSRQKNHNYDSKLDLSASSYSSVVFSFFLAVDKSFSASMASVGENFFILRIVFNICEVLGNGLLWFALAIYNLYYGEPEYTEHTINFIYGLVVEKMALLILKSIFKRPRPKNSQGKTGEIDIDFGPDKYSFPSGHASTAVYIACFITKEFRLRKKVKIIH
jgi:membrane-associated phospholipid phosphatase